MARLRSTALRVRVLVLVALILTPVLVLTVTSVFDLRRAGEADAQAKAEELALAIGGEHTRSIEGTHQLLAALAQLPAVRNGEGCPETLTQVRGADPRYANLGVIALDGSLVCSALPFDAPINLSDRAYFQRAVTTGDFAAGDYQIGRLTGIASLNFGYPVRDDAGAITGVVFAAVDLSSFGTLAESLGLPAGTVFTMFDRDGAVLSRYPDGEGWVGRTVELPAGLDDLAFVQERRLSDPIARTNGDGVEALAAIRTGPGGGTAYFAVALPKSATLTHAGAALRRSLAVLAIVALAGGAIAWWGGGMFVLRPVRRLAEAATGISAGQLDSRAPEHGPRELADLARSFNEMACAVEERTRELQEAKETKRAVIDASPLAIVALDLDGRVMLWNRAAERIFGWSEDDIFGEPNPIPEDEQAYDTIIAMGRQGHVFAGLEVRGRRKDGSLAELSVSTAAVRDSRGEVIGMMAVMADLTHQRAQERAIHRLTTHDALTGLPNRAALEERLAELFATAGPERTSALVIVGIDDLNLVHSMHPRAVGDELTCAIAALLTGLARPDDTVARVSADEFAVLIAHASPDEAQRIGDEYRLAVDAFRLDAAGEPLEPTVSVGIAVIDGRLDASQLLRLGDSALYAAKQAGGNQVVIYTSEDDRDASLAEGGRWVARIKDALRDGGLMLHYQPVVRTSTGHPVAYEALIRMAGDDGDVIFPDAFLPAAERFGLLPEIDRWVLNEAIAILKARPEVSLFVNVSGAGLNDDAFAAFVLDQIRIAKIEPGRLVIEVTETVAIRDFARVREFMRDLRQLGCRFALDDFGAGFSSFAYLDALPVDYIKIDGSLVRRAHIDDASRAILDAIAGVGRALDKLVIAEWVETREVAAVLRELDIPLGQGFLWGRPLPMLPPPLALAG